MKFFETTCFLIDKNIAEMGIKQKGTPVRVSVDLDDIVEYREIIEEEDIEPDQVLVYFRSGESTILEISYDDFKKLMSTK